MGDIFIALSVILYALVLYHRFQQGRAIKRLTRLLAEQRQKNPDQERTGDREDAPRDEVQDPGER